MLELRSEVLPLHVKYLLLLSGLEAAVAAVVQYDNCAAMGAGRGEARQVESGIHLSCTFFTTIFRELTSITGKNCEESVGTNQGGTAELWLEAVSSSIPMSTVFSHKTTRP